MGASGGVAGKKGKMTYPLSLAICVRSLCGPLTRSRRRKRLNEILQSFHAILQVPQLYLQFFNVLT